MVSKNLMRHIYKVKVYRNLGFKKVFKISSCNNIDEITRTIREQCDGNLVSFCDLKNNYIHFDRNTIDRIIVKEVK